MTRFQGEWLALILLLNALHALGQIVTIELIDWTGGRCWRASCVAGQ